VAELLLGQTSVAGGGHKKVVGRRCRGRQWKTDVLGGNRLGATRLRARPMHREHVAIGVGGAKIRALRERLRELAAARRRFGYRRLQVLLRREGFR